MKSYGKMVKYFLLPSLYGNDFSLCIAGNQPGIKASEGESDLTHADAAEEADPGRQVLLASEDPLCNSIN